MIKRVFLFAITNIAILVTISIVINLLGIRPYLSEAGIDYQSLMALCLVWGFGGAFISLAISRMVAKWMMGIKLIEPTEPQFQWLYNMVEQLAKGAGLPRTPQIGIYDSPEVNAFATGPTRSRALVAFSTGILRTMDRTELEGVAGHEISHIANGDMVTMTLLQGVINAFVMFLSRVLGYLASQSVREESARVVNMLVTITLDILLSILGSLVVMWFSRRREFSADRSSARLVGPQKMIAALQNLERYTELAQVGNQGASLSTFKIAGKPRGFTRLFMSHPPLAERIEALRNLGG
jgi:heat shock protein HtpX